MWLSSRQDAKFEEILKRARAHYARLAEHQVFAA
jgi:hypothetical protein